MPSASSSARSHHHRRRGRQAGCRHSRNHLQGCQHIRTRRWRQGRCRCRTRRVLQHMDRRRHNAVGIGVRFAVTTTAPRASSWLPSQSQSPSGCPHIRTRRWRQGRCRCRTRRVLQHMGRRRHRCRRHLRRPRSHPTDTEGVKLVAVAVAIAFRDVNIRTRRWRRGHCRCRTRRGPTHRLRVTNAIGILVGRAVTAADAEGVKLVAVAMQSPSGMSAHPHS